MGTVIIKKALMVTFCLLCCITAFLSTRIEAAGKFKDTYILPLVADLSGPNASNIHALVSTVQDYVNYCNEELGGIGGYELKTKWVDDKYNQAIVMTTYKELVAQGHKAIVFIASTPGSTVKSLANKDKVVVSCWANTDGAYLGVGEKENYVFNVCPPYADIFASFVPFSFEKLWPNLKLNRKPVIGGFNMDTSTGRQASKGIALECKKYGLQYVPAFQKIGSAEVTSQIMTLKKEGADIVTGIQLGNDTIVFFKDANRLDYHPIIGFHAAHEEAVKATGLPVGSWNYYVTGGWESAGYGKMRSYFDRHDLGKVIPTMTQYGWVFNIPIIAGIDRAIKKVGSKEKLTGTLIKEEMEKMNMENLNMGLTAPYNYTADDHRGQTGVRWAKLLDLKGNLEWMPWVNFPKRPQEQVTAEFWRE